VTHSLMMYTRRMVRALEPITEHRVAGSVTHGKQVQLSTFEQDDRHGKHRREINKHIMWCCDWHFDLVLHSS
jgi:hypothetical protein